MPFFAVEEYSYYSRDYVSMPFSAFFADDEYEQITNGMTINLSCREDDFNWWHDFDGRGYFEDCMATEINLTGSLRVIGPSTFEGCTNLVRVTMPTSVTEISGEVFSGCTALEEIALPDGLQSIGYDAFNGCTNLRSIIIPLSVTEISRDAFENCPRLTIYAEAESKPEDWVDGYVFENYLDWNPDDRPVIWGYRK